MGNRLDKVWILVEEKPDCDDLVCPWDEDVCEHIVFDEENKRYYIAFTPEALKVLRVLKLRLQKRIPNIRIAQFTRTLGIIDPSRSF